MPNFCPTCGKPLEYENAEICPSCGVRIQPPPAPQPAPVKPEIRNPPAAVILSFLFTGWGQWYNGQTWEGLKFFGAFVAAYLVLFLFVVMMLDINLDVRRLGELEEDFTRLSAAMAPASIRRGDCK